MERRTALINVAGAMAGLVSLPAWAGGWSAQTLRLNPSLLSSAQGNLLADIVDTIIPATPVPGAVDLPGAKALDVQAFIQKMVADCYDEKTQLLLKTGLAETDDLARKTFGKPFGAGDTPQRISVLTQLNTETNGAMRDFYALVKNLTIRGYMNSEYVMTNLTHFEFIPGRYHGCVPVLAKAVSQPK